MSFERGNVGDYRVHVFCNLDLFVCRSSLNNLIRGVPYLFRFATRFVTISSFRDMVMMVVMMMLMTTMMKRVTRRGGNAGDNDAGLRRGGTA